MAEIPPPSGDFPEKGPPGGPVGPIGKVPHGPTDGFDDPFGEELEPGISESLQDFEPEQLASIIENGLMDVALDFEPSERKINQALDTSLSLATSNVDSMKSKLQSAILGQFGDIDNTVQEMKARITGTVDTEFFRGMEPVVQTVLPQKDLLPSGFLDEPTIALFDAVNGITPSSTPLPPTKLVTPFPIGGPDLSNDFEACYAAKQAKAIANLGPNPHPSRLLDIRAVADQIKGRLGAGSLQNWWEGWQQWSCGAIGLIGLGLITFQEIADRMGLPKLSFQDWKRKMAEIHTPTCNVCDVTGDPPIDEPIPEETDCIELCGMERLLECLEQLCHTKDPEECPTYSVWRNCTNDKISIVPAGQSFPPEGDEDDWEHAGELEPGVNQTIQAFCSVEDPEAAPILQRFFVGFHREGRLPALANCELPGYVAIERATIDKLIKLLKTAGVAGVAATFLNTVTTVAISIPNPGWAGLMLLLMLVTALKTAQATWDEERCANVDVKLALVTRVFYTFWERILPGAFQEQLTAVTQHIQYWCPKAIPQQDQVNVAFLGDRIDLQRWECLTRANGNDPVHMAAVLGGQRSKFSVGELLRMKHRNIIPQQEYNDGIRALGFIAGDEAPKFDRASEEIPGPSDLIRFMVRDVEDQAIVQRFNLMNNFGRKFIGETRKWAQWQNIPQEVMEREWMAHWRYPGYRQLTESMHRFRNLPVGDPLRTTVQDVKVALEADDVPEFWVDRLIGMSFRVLTRVDTRRAYNIGAINEADVFRNYQDLGYSDISARQMTDFSTELKNRRFLKHPAVKKLAAGLIAREDAILMLKDDGADTIALQKALERADLLSLQMKTETCVKAIRKRFLEGEMGPNEALNELTILRIGGPQATQMIQTWECEKASRGKHASHSQLCQWFEFGVIDGPEFKKRLLNLGWDDQEADKIIKVCADRIRIKLTRQERAEMRREESERRREERERRAEANRKAALENKLVTAQDKARKSRLANDRKLARAAHKLDDRIDGDFADIFGSLRFTFNRLVRANVAHPDTVAQAILEVATDPTVTNNDQLTVALGQLLTPEESFGA